VVFGGKARRKVTTTKTKTCGWKVLRDIEDGVIWTGLI
jgi:hypothetical protein